MTLSHSLRTVAAVLTLGFMLPAWGLRHYNDGVTCTNANGLPDERLWSMVGQPVSDAGGRFSIVTAIGPHAVITAAHVTSDDQWLGRAIDIFGTTNRMVVEVRRTTVALDIAVLRLDGPPLDAWLPCVTNANPSMADLVIVSGGGGRGLQDGNQVFCGGSAMRWIHNSSAFVRTGSGTDPDRWGLTFEAGPTGRGGTVCYGDSGSAAIVRTPSGWAVLGIASQLSDNALDSQSLVGACVRQAVTFFADLLGQSESKPSIPVAEKPTENAEARLVRAIRDIIRSELGK